MANKKTEKCSFASDYGGGYIRPDQWVTERLCAVISKKEGVELPDKFWNLPKWRSMFRRQVQLAASLLVMYEAEPISRALKDKRSYNVRSFAAFNSVPFFSKILDEYQAKYETELKEQSQAEELETRSTTTIPKRIKKDNKLSRLKNIDGKTRPIQSG
jgi:hypothetical protein